MLANRCVVCRNAPASPPANNFMRSRRNTLSRFTFAAQLCDQASAALGQNLLQLSWDGYPRGAALAPCLCQNWDWEQMFGHDCPWLVVQAGCRLRCLSGTVEAQHCSEVSRGVCQPLTELCVG